VTKHILQWDYEQCRHGVDNWCKGVKTIFETDNLMERFITARGTRQVRCKLTNL
jgi:hypothetical protein